MKTLAPLLLLLAGCARRVPLPPAVGAPGAPAPSGDADLGRLMVWICAVSIVGFGVSVAAAVWLPIGKKTAMTGAAGFLAMLALAISVKVLLPYLLWIVVAMLLIGGAIGVYLVRRHLHPLAPPQPGGT